MLECSQDIEEFIENMDKTTFFKDKKTQSAVIKSLIIMGEAAKHVNQEIREQHKEIPFKEIAGMRDILIHNYY